MGNLKERAYLYRENSVSDSTKKTRKMQWNCYLKTCKDYGWAPMPCGREQACLYVTALASRLEFQSVLTYYQAVVYFHVCNGVDPVRQSDPVLKATLSGIERSMIDHKVGKDPLLPVHLVQISKVVDVSNDLEFIVFVAILLMFRTLLRVSHVVKSPHTLRRADVKFNKSGLLLAVRSSKTGKVNGEVVFLPVSFGDNPSICAVRGLKAMCDRFPGHPGDLLFSTQHCVGLSYGMFSNRFKKLVGKARLTGDFASHSLRKGGATFMSMSGCSVQEVKTRGGWKSDCVNRYIKPPISHKVRVDKMVAGKL